MLVHSQANAEMLAKADLILSGGFFNGDDASNLGFYFQDPEGDSDPATSDGLYVYTGEKPELNTGDAVFVTGRVSEYLGGGDENNLTLTQLSEATFIIAPDLFPALEIWPTPLNPPNLIIEDDVFGLFEPELDGLDYFKTRAVLSIVF